MSAAIDRCPFCGNKADVQNDFGRVFWVQCNDLDCAATDGTEHRNPTEAIKNWNRRPATAPTQPPMGEREALSFDLIEDAFPDGAFTDKDGFTCVSAQWLHDFANNIAVSLRATATQQSQPQAPSTLAQQITAAQAETAKWPPGMLNRVLGRDDS